MTVGQQSPHDPGASVEASTRSTQAEPSAAPADPPSLYRRLGGAWAIDVAAELFARKLRWDSRIGYLFTNRNTDEHIASTVAFLSTALGRSGNDGVGGSDLATARAELLSRGMTDELYDVMVELAADSFTLMGAGAAEVAEVTAIIEDERGRFLS